MKLGFVFPGQGAQFEGMGKDLYEAHEEVKEVYEKVKKETGIDVAKLSFDSDLETLSQTKNTQIAIFTMSIAITKLLEKENIKADISAGLSLGEYSGLCYSNMISLEDASRIVAKRGELMNDLVPEGNWAMAAVLGLADEEVEKLCKNIDKGFAVPANYNCPGHVVVSGDEEGITNVIEKASEYGAKRVMRLNNSGPFHTEKLEKASQELRKELNKYEFKVTDKKVMKNIDAKEYTKDDDIKDILAKHVISPVRFSKSIQNMIDNGVDTFIEIGPGKVLSGLVKRINKEVRIFNIQDEESLQNCISNLK